MFYLAAAVSDFYIPASEMPEHKIQSSNGPLQVSEKIFKIFHVFRNGNVGQTVHHCGGDRSMSTGWIPMKSCTGIHGSVVDQCMAKIR